MKLNRENFLSKTIDKYDFFINTNKILFKLILMEKQFNFIKTIIYKVSRVFFEKIANLFGYPDNPGMPKVYVSPEQNSERFKYLQSLPKRSGWPPVQHPETWFEAIFGPAPKIEEIPRYFYQSKEEGFYNFYMQDFKNLYFLPDPVSEFIQVRLDICLDITLLETIREVLFIGLVMFSQMITFRIAMAWLMTMNPYRFPWYFITSATDWTEDLLQGVVPTVLGVNATANFFLIILGRVADSLNNLVFTMPYLPSEGEETKILINKQIKDGLVFHYLPVLWARHPIPNNLREYWYYERPDILKYLQTSYKDSGINFLPEKFLITTDLLIKDNILIVDELSKETITSSIVNPLIEILHQYQL